MYIINFTFVHPHLLYCFHSDFLIVAYGNRKDVKNVQNFFQALFQSISHNCSEDEEKCQEVRGVKRKLITNTFDFTNKYDLSI